jgi:hypothetical protein
MTTLTESNLEPPPEQLCRIAGVAGILLQDEGRILINDFPLTPAQTGRIAELARTMCEGFRKVRRILRQVIIGYPFGQILVLSRDDAQLVLLLLDDASLNAASAEASSYLAGRMQKPLRLPSAPAPVLKQQTLTPRPSPPLPPRDPQSQDVHSS